MNKNQNSFGISLGPRVRKSPFFDVTVRYGAKTFTIYNHMYMPTTYGNQEEEYWHLVEGVTLWDVSVQRQIEISGPDALRLMDYMTPRDLTDCPAHKCLYVILSDQDGGIVNDAVLMRMDDETCWLSPGDGDVVLWARGLAVQSGLDVRVREADVYPLQLQGPKSPHVAYKLFGETALELGYYNVMKAELNGIPLYISRTGWSGELGYEIYLCGSEGAEELWETVMEAGREYDIAPAAPNTIRSIEGGLLSYYSDIRPDDNPYVLGLDRLVNLDKPSDFVGREALRAIQAAGHHRRLVGIEIDTDPILLNENFWKVSRDSEVVGHVSRCVWSPRLERNIGFANLPAKLTGIGTEITVHTPGGPAPAMVVKTPWFPAEKTLPDVPR